MKVRDNDVPKLARVMVRRGAGRDTHAVEITQSGAPCPLAPDSVKQARVLKPVRTRG